MMGRSLSCKTMKICTSSASIIYNNCGYVSSTKYDIKYSTRIPTTCISTCRQASTCAHLPEKREQLLEEHKVIRKGDTINLHTLLFTEYRDYVVRYIDNIQVQVKAAQLAGKVIVLYFLPLHQDYVYSRMSISHLIDTYTYLLPDNVFEVVLVAYGTAEDLRYNQSNFESILYHMPWTAIPFPDITSRERLRKRWEQGPVFSTCWKENHTLF
ncbi:hypothetical protein POM88_049290 [Heracleum sosnowskyi]|uniref:Uncharacterized protein n=1 Tax=Heracleum sosnowskyi TaxID=360622 RepID=A0AAD8GWN8_9APIA|nr:hypothetical protein POM88_049290 [Heracleum sosnowskyi]